MIVWAWGDETECADVHMAVVGRGYTVWGRAAFVTSGARSGGGTAKWNDEPGVRGGLRGQSAVRQGREEKNSLAR